MRLETQGRPVYHNVGLSSILRWACYLSRLSRGGPLLGLWFELVEDAPDEVGNGGGPVLVTVPQRAYRGTTPIRKSPPPSDHRRALGIVLL